MHLPAIDLPHQSQYQEPVAANRIHRAVEEVLANPLKWSRAELLERINGCWEDAKGILRALATEQGCVLMDARTGEIITPTIVQEELKTLSEDLTALAGIVTNVLQTQEGRKHWDSSDVRHDATAIHIGLGNLRQMAVGMAFTAQSVARGCQADPSALHLIFGGAQ